MIYRGPGGDIDIPRLSLPDFVLAATRAFGDRPALIDAASGRTVRFSDFEPRVKRFTGGLAARGLQRGDVVALYSYNVPEYPVAFHGAAALGCVVTTINPSYTSGEIRKQLEDCSAKLLIAPADLLERAREAAAGTTVKAVVAFEEIDGPEMAPVAMDPDDVVALPYSSGTTGLPKGVMLTHRNIVANLLQARAAGLLGPQDTLLGVLPIFHIYGLVLIANAGLVEGATTVTMPRFELLEYLKHLARYRVTIAHVVPPIILALAKHPAVAQFDLSALRIAFSGAAPLGAELSRALMDRLGLRVKQGYGLTETSPVTHIAPADEALDLLGSIGFPVPGTEVRLVDVETGCDAESGREGEVWIRGPQVMRGYLNHPEATAATITPEGWLRTGDLAYRNPAGHFFIVDRVKELIKFKGFQVPPAELEALLLSHPSIADAAVIGLPDPEAGELPRAYIVRRQPITEDEVKAFVAEHVATYKRLHSVAFIEAIPKSPSGKILRRVLKAQAIADAAPTS